MSQIGLILQLNVKLNHKHLSPKEQLSLSALSLGFVAVSPFGQQIRTRAP